MTPEAKLMPASFRHQIQARTAVTTMMSATATNNKLRASNAYATRHHLRSAVFWVTVLVVVIPSLNEPE